LAARHARSVHFAVTYGKGMAAISGGA
jgi:hypothetical protein